MSVNFLDNQTGIKQVRAKYTDKIDPVTGLKVGIQKDVVYEVIYNGLLFIEPIAGRYAQNLVTEYQLQEGQYYLCHFRDWEGHNCKVGDMIYWNRSKLNKNQAYISSGDDDILMEIKNVITSGLSGFTISSLEAICLINN